MHPIKDATIGVPTALIYGEFQSMHPIKDATIRLPRYNDNQTISIHAPYKGCNKLNLTQGGVIMSISIHAPYKGCNYHQNKAVKSLEDFNPCTL